MPQRPLVISHCGKIDPQDIGTFIKEGGFSALKKALTEMSGSEVVEVIKRSGLRGRGGAGFPTGAKWQMAKDAISKLNSGKSSLNFGYIICNADEGEVGTFKDRFLLEQDPFSLIEGICIAGYAIGAKMAFIYLRAEYDYLRDKLLDAIEQTKKGGFFDLRGHSFDIQLTDNAGAYVCGEETALMESIEGKRGEPRFKPPFPTTAGLWGRPTVINNVETLMNIPYIILNGAEWFQGIGTERSKGTKVFSVSGDVEKPGIYELELGSSLRELVEDICKARDVKMVQVGGASGRVVPKEQLDVPLSFETYLGAGAIIVYNDSRNAMDVALDTLEFFKEESCGKCVPCREGTAVLYDTLADLRRNPDNTSELKILLDIAKTMQMCSLCGLGQTAGNCFMDTLKYFPGDYRYENSDN